MAGPIFLLFFFFLPETLASNILLRRAARLRKISGNPKIRSQTEIDRAGISFRTVAVEAVIKPIEICIKDPAVCLHSVRLKYTGRVLIYRLGIICQVCILSISPNFKLTSIKCLHSLNVWYLLLLLRGMKIHPQLRLPH